MYIYNILIASVIILYFIEKKFLNEKSVICRYILFGLLLITSMFRIGVGTDYNAYTSSYQKLINKNLISNSFELGYTFLSKITSIFSTDGQAIIIVTSIIILTCIFITINKQSDSYYISIFLFITMYFYFNSFNIIRQFIAISIVFYCIKFIQQDKKIKFFIGIIIAVLFHKTAIIGIILIILKNINLKKRYYFMSIIAVLSIIPMIPLLIEYTSKVIPKYVAYINFEKGSGFGSTTILMLGICLISFVYKDKLIKKKSINNLYINAVFIGLLLQVLSEANTLLSRISLYFYIFSILLIPEIISIIDNKYKKKVIIGLIIFFTIYCNYLLLQNVAGVVPYESTLILLR